jgi:hypothetical protein
MKRNSKVFIDRLLLLVLIGIPVVILGARIRQSELNTQLVEAVRAGLPTKVSVLLSRGADPNTCGEEWNGCG